MTISCTHMQARGPSKKKGQPCHLTDPSGTRLVTSVIQIQRLRLIAVPICQTHDQIQGPRHPVRVLGGAILESKLPLVRDLLDLLSKRNMR